MPDDRRICVTVGMKANLGNYESADASICLSGLPVGATDAEIEEALDTAKVVFGKIAGKLRAKVAEIRMESEAQRAPVRSGNGRSEY